MKLRQMRGKYYARIRIWDGYKVKEHSFSLNTTDKVDAYIRLDDVKLLENEIKSGKLQPFQLKGIFRWQNASGTSTLIKRTIQDIVDDYLAYRKNKVRSSTANRDRNVPKKITHKKGNNKPNIVRFFNQGNLMVVGNHFTWAGLYSKQMPLKSKKNIIEFLLYERISRVKKSLS